MVGAICGGVVKEQGWEGEDGPSGMKLKMADREITWSEGRWKGEIEVGGWSVEGELEIIDSGGGWECLLGKPILERLGAIQDSEEDEVRIKNNKGKKNTIKK